MQCGVGAMTWQTMEPFHLSVGSQRLECRAWGPGPGSAPTIVLLHEGLGSVLVVSVKEDQFPRFARRASDAEVVSVGPQTLVSAA